MRFRLCLAAGLLAAAAARGATFTVTNANDSGAGSLREAINQANAAAGADTIAFNVSGTGCDGSGVCTIALASQLPSVSGTTTIDGYTQPGSSPNTNAAGAINAVLKIVVAASPGGPQGLIVTGSDVAIRGLVFNGGFSYTLSMAGANGKVQGCFIGTNAAGTAAVGPNIRGIYSNGLSTTIGGPLPADRNLAAGNQSWDVWAENVTNLTVQGNLIGTDSSGAAPIGGFTGGLGVTTSRAGTVVRDNVIGHKRNGSGIYIDSGIDYGTIVQGNFVGTDVTGTVNLGNDYNGIEIAGQQVTVGGIAPGEGNVVAFNKGAGVFVGYSTSIRRNPIRGNSIYSNAQAPNGTARMGIDLGESSGGGGGGFTPNDLNDGDVGPNDYQNFPMISSAVSTVGDSPDGGSTTIHGLLNSLANTQFDLDFYSNSGCLGRPQDFLEGRTYIGSSVVTTDGSGNATINAVLPVVLAPGEVVSATATDPEGNTSEFSQRIVVSSNPGSGVPTGAPITLNGFHFLSGATATVGGVAATSVVVADYNHITATTPSLPPGSLNSVTVTNTDGSAGTLPNGWIADFLDVPGGHIFYSYVTTLVRNQITVGVGSGNYGVTQNTLRQQMAVFLLKAEHGICYVPPPCTVPAFPDVPCASNFAPWINQLVAENITGGCAGGNFCPVNPVNRQQMAVFLLKTFEGGNYTPPACTVASFGDVPCSHPFATWIYELVARNITAGCGGGNYCPLTNANRGQMATFLVKTFNLQ
jgi:S-layer homology domain